MNKTPSSPHRSVRSGHGMTLAEVMLAMLILAFVALTLVRLTYLIEQTAENNLHQGAAFVLAQGYLDQFSKMIYTSPGPYTEGSPPGLQNIADDTTNSAPIYIINSTGAAATTDGNTLGAANVLYNKGTAIETVYLDQDNYGNKTQDMTFTFTPVLTDLAPLTTGTVNTAQGVEVIIYFTATYPLAGVTHTFSSSLRTVCSNVPNQ